MEPAKFPSFQGDLTSALVNVTRTVGQIAAQDLGFHRTSSAEFTEQLDEQAERVLALTSAVLKIAITGTEVKPPTLRNEDSIDENWHGVVDVIDSMLEKADASLDEFTGVIKKLSPSEEEKGMARLAYADARAAKKLDDNRIRFTPNIIKKPQLEFDHKPDNSNDLKTFKPLLKAKPNALVPLTFSESPDVSYQHPYETEIRAAEYPKSVYEIATPIPYKPLESTSATFVDTMDGVMEMLGDLKNAKEIAIDLEHHDAHSYVGLVSLMQISTRDKDWIVDTLKPWREELQVLNEVFTDPKILKVFHGSKMDIVWLQRDLGLYVVGLFDTFHAATALQYHQKSLKFLLEKIVNFEADKKHQMADWRIRPLPQAMFDYARSDTHFLLYIYDCLRNDLIENSTPEISHIDYVQERSKIECLQRYERSVYDEKTGHGSGGWYDMLSRASGSYSKQQFAIFKAVHKWRDEIARQEDENPQFVIPRHTLFKLVQYLPLDMGSLLRTLSPMNPLVKDRANDLLKVIKEANIAGVDGPEWRDAPSRPKLAKPTYEFNFSQTTKNNPPTIEKSQFWGNVLEVKEVPTPPEYSVTAASEAVRLSLPLPPMAKNVSEVREKLTPATPISAAPTAAPASNSIADEEKNKVFTVKELGGPRKRKSDAVEESPNQSSIGDDESNEMPDESAKMTKNQRKRARKQEKKATAAKEQTAPFDYGAADTVLNAPAASINATRRQKPFNPYAKALDAPSGARKDKREVPGKSWTYR
ncbi:hypothetical protein N7495_003086 [Penicillium taxi]|uniref:uncharacterized protein n=1 Tax=Penicillium taxi TaxID=168475 RepID=UPI002545A007|nr:uncharacterized protein N7495_003086 [Penicillium taxi]KAJ5902558.1 hypothetical protein N7495_003086 [Penicillium taxi]